jgi:hypothetical protein
MTMTRRLIAIGLGLLLSASQARASGLTDSIERAAEREAAEQQRPAARGEHPYLVPGLAMLGGGGVILLYGLVHETGGECSVGGTVANTTVKCETTHSTGTIVAGAAIAGVGAFLLLKGENQRSSPAIVAGPGRLGLVQRIRW